MLWLAQAGQPMRPSVRPPRRSRQHEQGKYSLSRWKQPRYMPSHNATRRKFSVLPTLQTRWRRQNKTLRRAKRKALSMHCAFSMRSSPPVMHSYDRCVRFWLDSADLGVATSRQPWCRRDREGGSCEGFRMTAPSRHFPLRWGPSSESLQGRNPRGVEGRSGPHAMAI